MYRRFVLFIKSLLDAKSEKRELYFLLIFLFFLLFFISIFDPIRAIQKTLATDFHPALDNILIYLLISSLAISLYSLRRWRKISNEIDKRKFLENKFLSIKSDLESQIQQKSTDLENVNSLLDNRNRDLEILNTMTNAVHNSLDVD